VGRPHHGFRDRLISINALAASVDTERTHVPNFSEIQLFAAELLQGSPNETMLCSELMFFSLSIA